MRGSEMFVARASARPPITLEENALPIRIAVGPGGGSRVLILSAAELLAGRVDEELADPIANFFSGNPALRAGVRVAAKDLDGDAFADVVTAPGPGAAPVIRNYFGRDLAMGEAGVPESFLVFDAGFLGGVFVG